MGYELIYSFCEKKEDGSYDMSNLKEMKKKFGKPFDESSLNDLAVAIIKQFSRRDILINGVKIFELVKKEISFKETKNGIVLKNRKFIFGETSTEGMQVQDEIEQPQLNGNGVMPHNNIMPQVVSQQNIQQSTPQMKRPIKWVSFDGEGITQDQEGNRVPIGFIVKKLGLQLSPNKKYPVFQEMDDPRDKRVDKFGQPALDRKRVYQIWDDRKREVTVSQDYFVPETRLVADELGFSEKSEAGPKLMFEGSVEGNVPDIRAMRR
jgi:hypothetical protein